MERSEEPLHTTWLHSDRFVPRRFVQPLRRFVEIEAASGIVLLVAAVAALVWANAPFGETYQQVWNTHLTLSVGGFRFDEPLRHIINDGLMAVFFFVVGLEIKRELVLGELRDPKAAALPAVAALGGMIGPALIYLAFAAGVGGEALRGWGIPVATDIAFAVGVLALLGSRVPLGAKLFLLALAIADDIGAITVIALFYTDDLSARWLGASVASLALVALSNRVGIRSLAVYVPLALAAWYCLLESGVHATLSGVALGLLTPAHQMYGAKEYDQKARRILDTYPAEGTTQAGRERSDYEAILLTEISREAVSPLSRLEHRLQLWSSFGVVPVFALANAGVSFAGTSVGEALLTPIALGVGLGLVIGKMVGVSAFAWLAVRMGWGRLPSGTGWTHVVGLAGVAGIGFTVALFVAELAFTDRGLADLAKVGVFAGSATAGILGTLL
ncbi:MAG: Na+/H+ antiporter NhaA, partial [Acidimicrobiia bacterium]